MSTLRLERKLLNKDVMTIVMDNIVVEEESWEIRKLCLMREMYIARIFFSISGKKLY